MMDWILAGKAVAMFIGVWITVPSVGMFSRGHAVPTANFVLIALSWTTFWVLFQI